MSKEIPILFSTPMVQAILGGRKTQTRRVIKGTALEWLTTGFTPLFILDKGNTDIQKYKVGDILWVRETFTICNEEYFYKASNRAIYLDDEKVKWKPSIFMPKEACRLFLKITDIKVERLQDINESECLSEGIQEFTKDGKLTKYGLDGWVWQDMPKTAKESFKMLWDKINGKRGFSWDSNPWLWCITFEKIEKP